MDAVTGLTLWTTCEGSECVVYARGELDFSVLRQLKDVLLSDETISAGACVIDCKEVTFIDSEVLKCLLGARKRFHALGKSFRLRECGSDVSRVLDLLGLSAWLAG